MILWNWPSNCPQCGCNEVHPHRPQIEILKPDELKWVCADVHCGHMFVTEKLMTGKQIFVGAYITHLRIKNPVPDKKGGLAIPPPRPYRCEVRLIFAKSPDAAIKVAAEDHQDHTIEYASVHSMEDLINDNCARSEHRRDP